MARRSSLAELATERVMNAPVPLIDEPPRMQRVPVTSVAPNPVNPRETVGDLAELAESMKTRGQLQPCTVVTRAAFVAIHPEHESRLDDASFVVVAGSRRRLAAERYGIAMLTVVVQDQHAADPLTFYETSVSENIDREDFAPLEEARALAQLIEMAGSGAAVAKRLGRSESWVSQRKGLLRLVPSLQELLRSGTLPVREARSLAARHPDEQEAAWEEIAHLYRGTGEDEDEDVVESQPAAATPKAEKGRASGPRPVRLPTTTPADFAGKMVSALPRDFVEAVLVEAAVRLAQHDGAET